MNIKFTSMKTRLTTFHNERGAVPGRKPVLALLMRLLWAAALVMSAFGASAGVVLTSLYSFTGTNDGANPVAGLVQGSDGNFYGTTSGTVFQMTPAGVLTTLVSDFGSSSALVQGRDGNF